MENGSLQREGQAGLLHPQLKKKTKIRIQTIYKILIYQQLKLFKNIYSSIV
jgi:hypothetical protein